MCQLSLVLLAGSQPGQNVPSARPQNWAFVSRVETSAYEWITRLDYRVPWVGTLLAHYSPGLLVRTSQWTGRVP